MALIKSQRILMLERQRGAARSLVILDQQGPSPAATGFSLQRTDAAADQRSKQSKTLLRRADA
jgi:hypothetical protein